MSKLLDLKFQVLQDNSSWKWVSITENPYYKSLNEIDPDVARGIFNSYQLLLEQQAAKPNNYGEFLKLFINMASSGFKLQGDPIRFEENTLNTLDGQLRCAILYYIWGEEAELVVEDNKVVAVIGAEPWTIIKD